MKKRTVRLSNGNALEFNYLIMVSVAKLKNYVEKYFGEPVDKLDKNISSCVEVLHDSIIGSVYKIDYVEPADLDDISQVKTIYIGQFGHLYTTVTGFNYYPITDIKNTNWYKFMNTQLYKTNLVESFSKDFKEAHKVALIKNKKDAINTEDIRHRNALLNIEEGFYNTFELLDQYGVEFFIMQNESQNK